MTPLFAHPSYNPDQKLYFSEDRAYPLLHPHAAPEGYVDPHNNIVAPHDSFRRGEMITKVIFAENTSNFASFSSPGDSLNIYPEPLATGNQTGHLINSLQYHIGQHGHSEGHGHEGHFDEGTQGNSGANKRSGHKCKQDRSRQKEYEDKNKRKRVACWTGLKQALRSAGREVPQHQPDTLILATRTIQSFSWEIQKLRAEKRNRHAREQKSSVIPEDSIYNLNARMSSGGYDLAAISEARNLPSDETDELASDKHADEVEYDDEDQW
ncbi:hypothetical protein SISSUDRAFT_1128824 [Sistotremastrum suecicum HHB10207 ss-3]|uniref:Uncharacterized protein n=1 Tax=Sistotremastrum suecicum HHB10207 ss-3 TaxID=1314776 RepID=A0A166DCI7_9AGAM|nr:hypothetical protein SISSUDRAFT_1128824 [Sistotremastrum suecicum HHB10207 ss-3]